MDMAVDPARQHQKPGRVDGFVSALKVLSDLHDATTRDPQIGLESVGGCDDSAALDDRVKCHEPSPYTVLRCWMSASNSSSVL